MKLRSSFGLAFLLSPHLEGGEGGRNAEKQVTLGFRAAE